MGEDSDGKILKNQRFFNIGKFVLAPKFAGNWLNAKNREEKKKAVIFMYRNVIDIRREVPNDVLKALVVIADKAFSNRAGFDG